jgi:hypothetical protein
MLLNVSTEKDRQVWVPAMIAAKPRPSIAQGHMNPLFGLRASATTPTRTSRPAAMANRSHQLRNSRKNAKARRIACVKAKGIRLSLEGESTNELIATIPKARRMATLAVIRNELTFSERLMLFPP